MTNFESVKKFMQTFGQEVKTKAGFPDSKKPQQIAQTVFFRKEKKLL